MSNPNIPSSVAEKAQNFIEGVRAGKTPPNSEPITPEVAAVVEAKIANLDDANKTKIRVALDALKSVTKPTESKESSLDSLFAGTRSDLMQQASKIANDIMEEELKQWKGLTLTQIQRDNIKLAIVDRIASGKFAQTIFGGVQGKLKSITDKFSKIDVQKITDISQIDTIAKEFSLSDSESDTKSIEETIKSQVLAMMQEGLGEIRDAHESAPQPTGFIELLAHPRALAQYKKGKDIPTLLTQVGDAQGATEVFKAEIQIKIQKLDAQILGMQEGKEKLFDTIARVPEVISGQLFGLLKWIFGLPIFGKFAAAFLGFNDPKTAIDELKMENRQRKSIYVLVSFGMMKDDKGQSVEGANRGKIGILKDVDFTGVNFQKLKPFMNKMKASGVDLSASDFWTRVFTGTTLEGGEGESKKVLTLPNWEEDNTSKLSAETIIKKLNAISEAPRKLDTPPVQPLKPNQDTQIPGATPVTPKAPEPAPILTPDKKPIPTRPIGPTMLAAAGAAATATVAATAEPMPMLRETALISAFLGAKGLPFKFIYSGGEEQVSFVPGSTLTGKKGMLSIGKQTFELTAKSGAISMPITGLDIRGDIVQIGHIGGPTSQPKGKIVQGIARLIILEKAAKEEIQGEEGSLIIERTA